MTLRASVSVLLTLLILPVSACAGAGDDIACGPTDTCGPAEAELAVTSVVARARTTDPDGLSVVDPEVMDISFTVFNNGRATSEPKPLQVNVGGFPDVLVSVPAIKAGAQYNGVVHIDAPSAVTYLQGTDTMRAVVSIIGLDGDHSNDTRATPAFHLTLPALRITTIVDSQFLRSEVPASASVRIENVSHYATMPASTQSYCIYDLGGACSESFGATAFDGIALPAIAPQQTVQLDHPVSVPSAATHHNLIDALTIGSCITPGSTFSPRIVTASACSAVRQVEVKPDLEACTTATLVPDQLTPGSPLCRDQCEIVVFRVEAQAGHTYRIELADGEEEPTLRWRTRYRDNPVDASRDPGFQPATSGTLYLATSPKFCLPDAAHGVVLRDIQ